LIKLCVFEDIKEVSAMIVISIPLTAELVGWDEPGAKGAVQAMFGVKPDRKNEAAPEKPYVLIWASLVKMKPGGGAGHAVNVAIGNGRVHGFSVGEAHVGDSCDLKVHTTVVDTEYVFESKSFGAEDAIHDMFVKFLLCWRDVGGIEFDVSVDGMEEGT
jgi:hypothetical protein